MNPSEPQPSTTALLFVIIGASMVALLVQVQTTLDSMTQGDSRDLLPIVAGALSMVAGAAVKRSDNTKP